MNSSNLPRFVVESRKRCSGTVTRLPAKDAEIEAVCENNVVTLATKKLKLIDVYLDARLVDLAKPVEIVDNARETTREVTPMLLTLCEMLAERGDPGYMFTVRIPRELKK